VNFRNNHENWDVTTRIGISMTFGNSQKNWGIGVQVLVRPHNGLEVKPGKQLFNPKILGM